ncbi:LytS/YhcK type 5TM receptor domain-containing protein [Bacillus dakarensis]|uniref:LytS/YhcK type 5TM receptor domain-containing protein n=1 Tax=Robertmurraya dakarensis TaxID=1926278 RepID=UPI000980F24E|nr:LytS/YhcK type 5TM receptor domain-containing protein [Bacillus dakarensis]
MNGLIENSKIVALIILMTYPLIKHPSLQRAILRVASTEEKIFLGIYFGALSIIGALTGVTVFNGIGIQSHLIGPIVGGMIGGPVVGMVAGAIGGLYRLWMNNPTSLADFISLIATGLAGSLFYLTNRRKGFNLLKIYLYTLACEAFSILMIYILIEPHIIAEVYYSMIGINMLIINPVGVMLLVSLIKDIQYNQNLVGANYAEKSLEIAKHTLDILKDGFHEDSATKVAKFINHYIDGVIGVEIENKYTFHVFEGDVSCSNLFDQPFSYKSLNRQTYEMISENDLSVIRSPLIINKTFIGYIGFYKWTSHIVPTDIKMIEGITGLLSLQIQNTYLVEQEKLLIETEYKALKAQVNPHFLYNTLNAIKTMIRIDTTKAQGLIIKLGDFYRRSLSEHGDIIPFIEELKAIKVYWDIQQARFGNRIELDIHIDEELYNLPIPTFIVQPLVENAIIHGFTNTDEYHHLRIKIYGKVIDEQIHIDVMDNGKGFHEEIIDCTNNLKKAKNVGIGLNNINRRLKSIYKNQHTFRISNTKDGAKVSIVIPVAKGGLEENEHQSIAR